MRARTTRGDTGGFTLPELLVAMSLFALLVALAWPALHAALLARRHVTQSVAHLRELQDAVQTLDDDLHQAVARPVRDADGNPRAALLTGGGALLALTRYGIALHPERPAPALRRVVYRLAGGKLLRQVWQAADRTQATPSVTRVLLHGVDSVTLRFLAMVWHDAWPPPYAPAGALMPRAVDLRIAVEGVGTLRRVIVLAGGAGP